MADIVTIEYRGILGDLPVGGAFTVDSCAAGVLRLRAVGTKPEPTPAILKSAKVTAAPIVNEGEKP